MMTRGTWFLPGLATLAAGLVLGPAAATGAWSWDENENRIDDHLDAVESQGLSAAFENGDLNARQLIDVTGALGFFTYGVHVKYASSPTVADEAALQGLGLFTHRYQYIPYIRSRATFAQIGQILALPNVLRVESLPLVYPVNDNGTRTMRAASSNFELFPTALEAGITGKGVVIAIIDTGVNDAPDSVTGFPGHESLSGKFLGGGDFSNADPILNTPIEASKNPVDRSPDFSHGSHVAGTAMGTGGPTGVVTDGVYGYYRGIAPDARLVDCKALSDAGVGRGGASEDALDWIIYHRDDDWGQSGEETIYRGIQVVNMSLGSLLGDSDGTDASSAAVNAAVKAGIAVCVSTGNDGEINFISSPSAADRAISVGASVDANTVPREDDIVADFSNEGPRRDDGDADHLDEMKPSVCPPGGGVTSVEGVLTASGDTYVTTNGTSMSSPMAAGICALLIQSCPGIKPDAIKRILQDTADHRTTGGKQPPSAVDPFGQDPNYHPSWGWGNPDAYAGIMEARFPNRTQVVREWGEPVLGGIDVHWITQREVNVAGFRILRADPIYGQRGPFQMITAAPIAPTGDPEIHATSNRTAYNYADRDPSLVPGETYWYRIQWTDAVGGVHDEPAFRVIYDPPVALATVQWSITHNFMDNDLLVLIGSGADASDPTRTASFFFPGQGTGAADSMKVNTGHAWAGTRRWFYHRTLTDKDFGAAQVLPPGPDNPWFLSVTEGGFVNTNGRIEDFRITVHAPGGDVTLTPLLPLFPLQTAEGVTHVIWIPQDPLLSTNHAPVLDPIGDREAMEGRTLEFQVSASDPDGDGLSYSAPELPPGASFDAGTRTFSWSPAYDAVAATTTFTATFTIQDPLSAGDTETISIRLHDVDPNGNLPPYWNPLPDQSVVGGSTLTFKVSAVDPEGDPLTYAAIVLPPEATFDPATRCFDWSPTAAGDFTAVFSVSDAGHPALTEQVQITVKQAPLPSFGCENEIAAWLGTSSVGSFDLGMADLDTVLLELELPVVRFLAELRWFGGPAVDLDFYLYDEQGNVVGSGASLSEPESFTAADLDPGIYRFVVVGYTVPLETDWGLQVKQCTAVGAPVLLSRFTAHPGEEGVRLEWAAEDAGWSGFHVYRSDREDGDYARITRDIVTGDASYAYVDRGPFPASERLAFYLLEGMARDGSSTRFGPLAVDLRSVRAGGFYLAQNVPNPVPGSASTRIRFRLGEPSLVHLQVFDLRGAMVKTLVEEVLEAGEREVVWNGENALGQPVARGLYFYRLEVPGKYMESRRMILVP